MILKTYSIANDFPQGVLIDQLNDQITAAVCITNFSGLSSDATTITIYGDSMDETALDAVIAAHVPNYLLGYVQNTVVANKAWADDCMQRFKQKNLLEGLSTMDQAAWVHHRMRKVDYTLAEDSTVVHIDLMNLIVSGDIELAYFVMGQMAPDDMSKPYHWWTQARIDWVMNEIATYLGWI